MWVEIVLLLALLCVVTAFGLVLLRQRHMLRSPGGIPLAVRRGARWLYGVGVYDGDQLRYYRALGFGTRPSRLIHRTQLQIVAHRAPTALESQSVAPGSIVVELRDGGEEIALALSEDAYTGFISWLESSAPRF